MSLIRGLMAAATATVMVVAAVPSVVPVSAPRAQAQAHGSVTVDLEDLVGSEWFYYIGERNITLERIPGVDPATRAGHEKLTELNVPELLAQGAKFEKIDEARTIDGTATFTDLPVGVYYLSVADSPTTQDRRVSYAPTVVVVATGSMDRDVAPKPQQVAVTAGVQTKCTAVATQKEAVPGSSVSYQFTATAPNPSKDGTIGKYEITVDFSVGHTLGSEPSTSTPPHVTLHGGGQSHTLSQDVDFSWAVAENSSIGFVLTEAGRTRLAELRKVDPRTAVEIRIPATVNGRGLWGTVTGEQVLGSLEATAILLTDGMNATRDEIDVAHTSHVNIINRAACSGTAGGGSHGSLPGSAASDGATGDGAVSTAAAGNSGEDGSGSASDQPHQDGPQGRGMGTRTGLASTGASVVRLTLLGLVLIGVGLVLSRRSRDTEAEES